MKPEELGCFEQVKDVLGELGAIQELQKVIDSGVTIHSKGSSLASSFTWDSTQQGWDFWYEVSEDRVPKGYEPPSSTKEIIAATGITSEQMDEIKYFIVQTVKDKLSVNVNLQPVIGGLKADSVIVDDPAANDDVFKEPKIVPWKPVGGDYYINTAGCVHKSESTQHCSEFGTERPTREQAEKARDEMRVFNRLLAYRDEFDPDFDFEEAGCGSTVYHTGYGYATTTDDLYGRNVGTVYMSKAVAEELCRKLSNGEVVL